MRLGLPLLVLSMLAAQPESPVTATRRVELNDKMITVRQINGRWWTPDNREVSRTNASWLWTIGGGSGQHLVRFDHHRPVNPALVASLSRSMGPGSVRSILGPPNQVFPSDQPENHQQWTYFGANGYELRLHFASWPDDGSIFNASVALSPGELPKDVPHLSVGGSAAGGAPQPAATLALPALAKPVRAEPVRRIPATALDAAKVGMTRQALVAQLGPPAARNAVNGGDIPQETLTYYTEAGDTVRVKLLDGRVTAITRF